MMARRDIVIGGAFFAAASLAHALTPRRHMSLMGRTPLEQMIPQHFGGWRLQPGATAAPEREDSLAQQLYDQIVTRQYLDAAALPVTLLCAHGPVQTDALQLHRPEVCYPAFGYDLTDDQSEVVHFPSQMMLPIRRFTARKGGVHTQVSYWVRIGEDTPASAMAQRIAIIRAAMAGVIGDGMLVRLSTMLPDNIDAAALHHRFLFEWVSAILPQHRAAFIGARANGLRP